MILPGNVSAPLKWTGLGLLNAPVAIITNFDLNRPPVVSVIQYSPSFFTVVASVLKTGLILNSF